MDSKLEGITLTPLKKIPSNGGSVMHGLRSSESSFYGFGEVYFSQVSEKVRGWKYHKKMVSNLIVCNGEIRFVVADARPESHTLGQFLDITLNTSDAYMRLTIQPGLLLAFQGRPSGILVNIASVEHDPEEAQTLPLDTFDFNWE